MVVALALRDRFPRHFGPQGGIESWKTHVSIWRCMNAGPVDPIGAGQNGCVDVGPANHHDLIGARRSGERAGNDQAVVDTGDNRDACSLERWVAADDDVVATIERLLQRLKGLAAHDYGFAHGQSAEGLEVRRHAPRQCAIRAYDAIVSNGDDERDEQFLKLQLALACCCGTGAF
jgi:hypothetical protein